MRYLFNCPEIFSVCDEALKLLSIISEFRIPRSLDKGRWGLKSNFLFTNQYLSNFNIDLVKDLAVFSNKHNEISKRKYSSINNGFTLKFNQIIIIP